MRQLSPRQLADWLSDSGREPPLLLDVREAWEYETCHLAGARHLPLRTVPARFQEFDPGQEVVVICHHGGRSMQGAMFLENAGFSSVYNLVGGVDAWAQAVDPAMRRY